MATVEDADELADALDRAIEADDAEQVHAVVEQGLQRSESYNTLYEHYEPSAPKEFCGPNGDWALDRAVHQGNVAIARELFRAGATPNTSEPDEYPSDWPDCPVHHLRHGEDLVLKVAFGDNAEMLRAFVAAGADLGYATDLIARDLEPEDAVGACRRLFGALEPDAVLPLARQILEAMHPHGRDEDRHDLRALLYTTMRPTPLPLSPLAALTCVYAVVKFGEAAKRARTKVAAAALLVAEQEKWIRGLSKSQRKKARKRQRDFL